MRMRQAGTEHLRVLVAVRRPDRAERAIARLSALGYDVLAAEPDRLDAGPAADGWPDVTLLELGDASHALELIDRLAAAAAWPIVVLTDAAEAPLAAEAAAHGAFAWVTHQDQAAWPATIEIALRRFRDYRSLATAFERRAVIERAKGILMERHSVDEGGAFEFLRRHARDANQQLVDVATGVLEGHALLPRV